MTSRMRPILVTGATGRIGRLVVEELVHAGVPVRALTRRPAEARLPKAVEIVAGDFTVPESLDRSLQGVSTVFLMWTAPPASTRAPLAPLSSALPKASTAAPRCEAR